MKQKLYLIFAGLFLLTVQLKAQAPNALNYQGVARNSSGATLNNQHIGLQFTILQGSSSGTNVYQETDTATTNQFGVFTTAIGNGAVVSGTFSAIDWGKNSEYLQVAMDPTGTSYTIMGTQQLLSVPYSLYAAKSGGGNWTLSGNNIYNNNSGSVGIGTTTPAANAEVDVQSSHTIGATFNDDSLSSNAIVVNVKYTGTGAYNAIGVYSYSRPVDGAGYGAEFIGGWYGSESISVGSTEGYSYYGSYGAVLSSAASYTYGATGYAQSDGGVNYGVTGDGEDEGDGFSYGVFGYGTSATGVAYGLYGIGAPVGGYAAASGTGVEYSEMGTDYGISTHVSGLMGEVIGSSGSNTTDWNDGILGVTTNPDGQLNDGVFGFGTGGTQWNIGVEGISQSTGTDYYSIGVYGACNVNDISKTAFDYNDAGYFAGDVEVIGDLDIEGNLSKTGGTFKIDDPLDPANKFLYHSFVESPDMMNVYNGEITTDANGNATVALPQYFQAENKDFKYQLTVIGQFAQAIVATRVNNNQFTIKTDKPNVAVSWQVTGVRNDPWASDHRVVAEVEKKGIEKGRYLFPQYYGQPQSLSIASLMVQPKSLSSMARIVHNPVAPPQRPSPNCNANATQLH